MNKFYLGFFTAFIILSMLGCASVKGIFGKSASKESHARAVVTQVDNATSKLNVQKLDRIGEYSYGIKLVTNTPPAVTDLNERIGSLANQPTLEAMKEMEKLVSQLMTNNHKLLLKKDKEIEDLQEDAIKLGIERETAINKYIELASETAMKTDTLTAALKEYQGWFGLKAVFKGLWQFIKSAAWGIGIFSVLFVVLRIASMSNPMAASIFSIFSRMGSWIINIVEYIVPKAVEKAGHIASDIFNVYKSTLTKVVDSIQMAKERAAASGKPADIGAVLDELAKSMNPEEKAIVDELKKALNWN